MKIKAYSKNVLRTISGNFRRFLSMMFIIILGVSFFIGLISVGPDMRLTVDDYAKTQNVYDINIISKMALGNVGGFSGDDLKVIKDFTSVESIEGSYFLDTTVQDKTGGYLMRVHNLPTDFNKLVVVSGRLPLDANECVIDEVFAANHDFKLNNDEKITINNSHIFGGNKEGDISEFKIVGTVHSPIYISEQYGTSFAQGIDLFSFIYVTDEVFFPKVEETKNSNKSVSNAKSSTLPFTGAYLKLKGTGGLSVFSKEYKEICKNAIAGIKSYLTEKSNENPNLNPNYLYQFDKQSHIGYVSFEGDAESIDGISKIIPIIFFLVAILVSFTIMIRIIETDRASMAALRSLGYGSFQIFTKYLLYALGVAIPGTVAGVAIGFWMFPKLIFNLGYKVTYILPSILTPLNIVFALISLGFALLSVLLPTIIVCIKELRSSPANLMRPKAPKAGKKIVLEKIPFLWKHLSFSSKVTARNIFRGKRRSIMTIVGIIGCTALLVTGIGIDNSISDITKIQYDKLHTYDYTVNLNSEVSPEQKDEVVSLLTSEGGNQKLTAFFMDAYLVGTDNATKELKSSIIVPDDEAHFNEYIHFFDTKTKKEFFMEENKVVVSQKISKVFNVKKGDFINLKNNDGKIFSVEISGITVNHINHYVYLPKALYSKIILGEETTLNYKSNTIVGYLNEMTSESKEELSQKVIGMNVGSFVYSSYNREFLSSKIDLLKVIVFVIILCGALLAFVVLFSLTGMNIDERTREIATLKVLGFNNRETNNYIFRENIVLTVIGILLGLLGGFFMHKYVIAAAETEMMALGNTVHWYGYLIAGALSFVFMIIVNLIMQRSIKKIDMIESLKSVE